MPRVLCCALSSDQGPHLEILPANGINCVIVDSAKDLWHPKTLRESLQGFDAVIAGSEPYPDSVIFGCPQLRVIARAGVGFDAVDLAACDLQGVVVTTTPGVNHHAVAEQAIAMMVSLSRDVVRRDRDVRAGVWTRESGPRLWGQTLGLVGLGRIGQAVAVRADGLGMRVVAADPFIKPSAAADLDVDLLGIEELLCKSDYVSLHAPVDGQTQGMINSSTIQTMKPGARIINTARGQLIDESALIDALQSGHLGGAGLDVFDSEPLAADSPLMAMDNVILSGHIGGLDDESHRDTYLMIAETLIQLRDGGWPQDQIRNLEGVTDWTWLRS